MVTHWTPEELADMAQYDAKIDSEPYVKSTRAKTGKQATQAHRDNCKRWREKKLAERQEAEKNRPQTAI